MENIIFFLLRGHAVNKEYLIDLGLKGEQLKDAENFVKEFYWEDNAPD